MTIVYDRVTKREGRVEAPTYPAIYGENWKPVIQGTEPYRYRVRWSTGFVSHIIPELGYLIYYSDEAVNYGN